MPDMPPYVWLVVIAIAAGYALVAEVRTVEQKLAQKVSKLIPHRHKATSAVSK